MFERPIVMLDFETTGLSPEGGDRITEVAALRIAGGQIVDRYVSLVNCGVRVPSFITQLTGITQAMVDGAPPAAEAAARLTARTSIGPSTSTGVAPPAIARAVPPSPAGTRSRVRSTRTACEPARTASRSASSTGEPAAST